MPISDFPGVVFITKTKDCDLSATLKILSVIWVIKVVPNAKVKKPPGIEWLTDKQEK
jgi:hypothetical protein